MSLSSFINAVGNFFLPQVCAFCGNQGLENGRYPICEDCLDDFIPITPPYCARCGKPFSGTSDMHVCSECITAPPPFEKARSLFAFKGRARDLVIRMKYRKDLSTLTVFKLLIERCIVPDKFFREIDCIVPVPLDKNRLKKRGYNQALLMAECLGKYVDRPIDRAHLVKIKLTPPQVGLTRAERRSNIRGAFSVRGSGVFQGKAILLMDDVFTTGATARACSRTLLQSGARSVNVITFARTVSD